MRFVGAGFKPALPRHCALPRPGAVRRLCEAPVSQRYVGRYRCEAIQCQERNIRLTCLRIVGLYVNRGLLRRVSMVRIASAVAASQ
ncbi:MAG: hypothetical protein LBM98_00900 [Oscillospiraceae bacterium]|nr:hypothetical protein [Oscillospiraceae bacterium]